MSVKKLEKFISNKNLNAVCVIKTCVQVQLAQILMLKSYVTKFSLLLKCYQKDWSHGSVSNLAVPLWWKQPGNIFQYLVFFYIFFCHCMSQLQRVKCFIIETHTILLKSYILKISRPILQTLVMSLSIFKRRSFTMSYFEINMSIRIKYCSCINCQVCLGYYKLCFGSVSSIVFFQLILQVLGMGGGVQK